MLNVKSISCLLKIFLAVLFIFSGIEMMAQENIAKSSKQDLNTIKPEISLSFIIPGERKGMSSNLWRSVGNLILGQESSELVRPVAVAAVDTGEILIADQGKGEIVQSVGANYRLQRYFKQRESKLPSLAGLCYLSGDTILFTDSSTGAIYQKNGRSSYSVLNDSLELDQPTGIAVSPVSGELWVIETRSHMISILNRYGIRLKTIGRRGSSPGEFNYPTHIWIDREGNAYIVDALNFRVQVFNSKGEFIYLFGQQGDATGFFARPKGIATDSKGNIYVADALFNSIQVFDKNGNFSYYFGQQGNNAEDFWLPAGIYIDKNDFLYIADSYNSRIKVYKIDYR